VIHMAFTYSGDPGSSWMDAIRFRIGDTDASDPMISDDELKFLYNSEGTVLKAAYEAALSIAAKFSRKVPKTVGNLSISYQDRVQYYTDMAASIKLLVGRSSIGAPISTGPLGDGTQSLQGKPWS
jgi:hypothetical protein